MGGEKRKIMVAELTNARCAAGNRVWCAGIISCSAASVSVNGPRRWDSRR